MVQATDRNYVLSAGADEFLIKPNDLENFVPTVKRLIASGRTKAKAETDI
jgi:DNA-binding response OmpR family regulator